MTRTIFVMTAVFLVFLVFYFAILTLLPARAHQAPTGWAYPLDCCSDKDCIELPDRTVRETRWGYALPRNISIRYNDGRIRPSPDGKYHWCGSTVGTRCFFVPPRAL